MKEKNKDKSVSKCQLRDGGKRRYEGYASFLPLRREWIVVVQKGISMGEVGKRSVGWVAVRAQRSSIRSQSS